MKHLMLSLFIFTGSLCQADELFQSTHFVGLWEDLDREGVFLLVTSDFKAHSCKVTDDKLICSYMHERLHYNDGDYYRTSYSVPGAEGYRVNAENPNILEFWGYFGLYGFRFQKCETQEVTFTDGSSPDF